MDEMMRQRERACQLIGQAALRLARAAEFCVAGKFSLCSMTLHQVEDDVKEAIYATDLAKLLRDNVR